ncbi:MAG: hypothetical protein IPL22_06240 [Bacteroidetes bacterium]|nr:hypothetical protein [Bacteroidota bacterium]
MQTAKYSRRAAARSGIFRMRLVMAFILVWGWIGQAAVFAQCSPPLAFPPCNGTGTFTGNLGIPSGVAQGICLGLADSLPIEVTTIGVADSVIICWPFGSPAVESFSSNVNSIFKRKIPYNPDTVCVGSITATIYAVVSELRRHHDCSRKENISYDLYPKPKAQFTAFQTIPFAYLIRP